ncbi:hypothetical protein MD484_g8243, partial [Candolleomyces efflorescens]
MDPRPISHYHELIHFQDHSQDSDTLTDNPIRSLDDSTVQPNSISLHTELVSVKQQLNDATSLAEQRGKLELKRLSASSAPQVFLTKDTDTLTVTDVVHKLNALNDEIFKMGAYLGELLVYQVLDREPGGTSRRERRQAAVRSPFYKYATMYLGETLTDALSRHSENEPVEESNPLLVQIIMQIALTNWCSAFGRRWTSYHESATTIEEEEDPEATIESSRKRQSASKQTDHNRFLSELYDHIRYRLPTMADTCSKISLCETGDGFGCGGVFSRKREEGLCAKCATLSTLDEGSEDYNKYQAFKQCGACGKAWRFLRGNICGSCVLAGGPSNTQPSSQPPLDKAQLALDAAAVARGHAMTARLTKEPAPAFAPGGPLSGSASAAVTSNGTQVMCKFACRVKTSSKKDSKNIDTDLGSWCTPFPRETYMSEVFDDALANVNHRWSKIYGMDLIEAEVELRFSGNKTFLRNTEGGTINDICMQYLTGPMGEYYGQPKPAPSKHATSAAARAQSVLSLELFINKVAFIERSELVHCGGGLGSDFGDPNTTRTRASRKRSGTHNKKKASATRVEIERADCVQSQADSRVEISWPEETMPTIAVINHAVFAAGRTKRVHELKIEGDNQNYVAKRFFTGGENGAVTAEENESLLECELIRLKVLEWLVKEFLFAASSDEVQVEHYHNISVSDGFLVREIGQPSSPSGFPSGDVDGAIWLVEPKRTRSVVKFCGTLGHPERNDKVGMTISALCHWIYIFTRKTEVYSDMQGSYMTIDGTDTLILFDPMTHTLNQDSGIGDYGEKGIKKFLAEHQCNYICRGLSLGPITDEVEDYSDSEDGGDDD